MIKNVDDDNDMTTYLMKRVIYEATAAEAAAPLWAKSALIVAAPPTSAGDAWAT